MRRYVTYYVEMRRVSVNQHCQALGCGCGRAGKSVCLTRANAVVAMGNRANIRPGSAGAEGVRVLDWHAHC